MNNLLSNCIHVLTSVNLLDRVRQKKSPKITIRDTNTYLITLLHINTTAVFIQFIRIRTVVTYTTQYLRCTKTAVVSISLRLSTSAQCYNQSRFRSVDRLQKTYSRNDRIAVASAYRDTLFHRIFSSIFSLGAK